MHPIVARKALVAYNGYGAGLGNRLRVVLAAQSLAEFENRDFSYVWPTGELFGPRLSQLFGFDARVVSRATSRALARFYPYLTENLAWLDDPAVRARRIWQIRTGGEIHLPPGAVPWQAKLRALEPNPRIQERVRAAFDRHFAATGYIGVMIRAHSVSHQETKDASPVDWYLTKLREIREADPQVPIFLSCDVPEVQEYVQKKVPGCWGFSDKGAYNSVEGVESSVCDLYLLASSGYLIAPHFSSFIHLAQHLAGDSLPIETSRSAPKQRPVLSHLSAAQNPLTPLVRAG